MIKYRYKGEFMEKNILSYCGYDCKKCPVYQATEKNNLELLKAIVITPGISNLDQTIENLGCYGCCDKKTVNVMCESCPIRNCALDKEIINCGYCENFPCEKLSHISDQTKELLTEINQKIFNRKD